MTTVSRVVQRSADEVFAVLGNGWLNGSWEMGTARIRAVDPGWPTAGSRLHHSTGVWPILINDATTVLDHDPPRRLVLQARVRPVGVFGVTIEVVPLHRGCRIDITATVVGGMLRLVPTVLTSILLRLRNRESLNRLAVIIEGRSTATVASRGEAGVA